LPPAGRIVCRKRLDPQAHRWWEAWQATRDTRHLERILNSAYLSSVGDDALWALAEAAWDRGDFSLADFYWGQLDPAVDAAESESLHYPDPDFSPPDIQARRIQCDFLPAIHRRGVARLVATSSQVRDSPDVTACWQTF
jgi:hypothetical protein